MNTPYVGITDFASPDQVLRILDIPRKREPDTNRSHVLGVGVMMSYKTLNDLPTKWSAAFPAKGSIADIFLNRPDVFNVLHYADYDAIDVASSLERATAYGGPNMACIQLDMIWPDTSILRAYRIRHPGIKVIIQANTKALEQIGDDQRIFREKLWEYEDTIDYVLLDKSMGKGLGMDAKALLPFAETIERHLPHLDIVAAGGLGPSTLHLVEPLAQRFPRISIDAQGKLRKSGSALDPIDWDMAEKYYAQATLLLGQPR